MKWKPLVYFGLQRAIGSRVHDYWREFLAMERATVEELNAIQQQYLCRLLRESVRHVPYYRERVSAQRPVLSDFPILSKTDIRNYAPQLMRPDLREEVDGQRPKRGYSWLPVQTGGSTGMPTTVIHDPEYRDRGRAGRLYSRHLCGFPLGTQHIKLWGAMQDIHQTKDSLTHRLQSFLGDEIILNAFRMNDDDIERYIRVINATKAEHMMAYGEAAEQLARYATRNGRSVKPLRSIMACAGTVTDDMRKVLQECFDARVHNQYGSRDCSGIACECDHGRQHIYAHNILVEVVRDDGSAAAMNETGRILVTLLGNRMFPVIRYDIGDAGALSAEVCPCGRPFPLLARVEGRSLEFLVTSRGGFVTPIFIRHLIGVVHNPGIIRRFQLIQDSRTSLELKLEVEPTASADVYEQTVRSITGDLKHVFGSTVDIRISKADRIPETATGKFLYTINRIDSKRMQIPS